MTCIVWDGVTLVCDSKVTARAAKEEVRMGVIKMHILTKPLFTDEGDKILALSGAGRMDLIEFYLDRAQSAASAGTTVESLIKNINEFSLPRGCEHVDIIAVGTNAAGTETRCFTIGRALNRVQKGRAWGSGSNSNKEIVEAFISIGSLGAVHGLSCIDHGRCGLPFHEFNPMTRGVTTHHEVPEDKALVARDILDTEFKRILDRIFVKPVGRRKTK